MSQRACTLTFKSSDATTHTITLPLGAGVTPRQVIADVKGNGGFWSGDSWNGQADYTGVTAGSVWVAWEQVVSVTIS
jgi:hypothetical protein